MVHERKKSYWFSILFFLFFATFHILILERGDIISAYFCLSDLFNVAVGHINALETSEEEGYANEKVYDSFQSEEKKNIDIIVDAYTHEDALEKSGKKKKSEDGESDCKLLTYRFLCSVFKANKFPSLGGGSIDVWKDLVSTVQLFVKTNSSKYEELSLQLLFASICVSEGVGFYFSHSS
jgi:hypothetical protein